MNNHTGRTSIIDTQKVIIIGAGPGGLTAGMLLAAKGYEVQVYEKTKRIGGRNSALELGLYRFDRGPTFLNMPQVVEEIFQSCGRNLNDYVEMVQLDPMYRLVFGDLSFHAYPNREQMIREIEACFPGNSEGYDRFMKNEAVKLAALLPILQNKFDSIFDYLRPRFLKAIPKLTVTKSLYDCLADYFTDERLRLAFTFQAKYLGMSPWDCPGAFSILSYIEHAYGIHHPIGGLHQIPLAMKKVILENNGKVFLERGVDKLMIEQGKVKGVLLEDGEKVFADEVIVNADFAYAMNALIEPKDRRKYTPAKLSGRKYSCSTFMLYLGVDRLYEQTHHTIVFADDYRLNVDEITKSKVLSADPSIYIHNPSVTDGTLAPQGHSAIYILAPVPSNGTIDWDTAKASFREKVLALVEEKGGFPNLRQHIVEEAMITPADWEHEHYIYKGATFNLAHNLGQMMYNRPHNQFEELQNCWLVGGGTHPGSGLPTIMESARISVAGIIKKYAKKEGAV